MAPRHRRVVWTVGARVALGEAIAYVAGEAPGRARALLERVLHSAASLADLSERGRIVPESDDPAVRELLVRPYRLLYRVNPGEVQIIALLHERRSFDHWCRGGT